MVQMRSPVHDEYARELLEEFHRIVQSYLQRWMLGRDLWLGSPNTVGQLPQERGGTGTTSVANSAIPASAVHPAATLGALLDALYLREPVTNGDPAFPEIVFDQFGDVVMA